MNKKQFITSALVGLALYLIATGLSFGIFSLLGVGGVGGILSPKGTQPGDQEHFLIDPSAPKTEACPINGKFFTKQEREIWEKRRPLAVMIENHTEARPQSGLSYADVVYEAVAEGGITRFMGIFYCGVATPVNFAPVRSARTYFLPWVLEYDALYNHVGGAGRCSDPTVDERAKALCQIEEWDVKDMDQFGLNIKTRDKKTFICYRNPDRLDHEVATEHTMVCTSEGLYDEAMHREWTNVDEKGIAWDKEFEQWKFKDDSKENERGAGSPISFVAWDGYERDFGVRWDYDRANNVYLRSTGGAAHLDLETNQQLSAKNIIVLFARETGPVDEHAHLLYNNTGSGEGLLFQDGKAVTITWRKPTRTDRTKFFDASGKEISFNRGQIWIEMLPTGTKVTQ